MRVILITLSNNSGFQKKFGIGTLHEAIEHLAYSDVFTRAAFVGKTELGRAGVALELYEGEVRGHKIDPIPPELIERVEHFPAKGGRDAFKIFADYKDILIGDTDKGILLRWNASIEVFGAGEDSMAPP